MTDVGFQFQVFRFSIRRCGPTGGPTCIIRSFVAKQLTETSRGVPAGSTLRGTCSTRTVRARPDASRDEPAESQPRATDREPAETHLEPAAMQARGTGLKQVEMN